METQDVHDLERKAMIYGQQDEVARLRGYLDTHEGEGFLPWPAYQRYRRQFGAAPLKPPREVYGLDTERCNPTASVLRECFYGRGLKSSHVANSRSQPPALT